MKIYVKSNLEFWHKENIGIKLNTVRKLDGNDTIEIENTKTGKAIVRTITDISVYEGNIIISFSELEQKKSSRNKSVI